MEYLFIVVLLLLLFAYIANVRSKLHALETRIKSMNVILDRVASHTGLPEHPINDVLRELLKEGKDVQAVKEARLALGLSLLEAKKYVDSLKDCSKQCAE